MKPGNQAREHGEEGIFIQYKAPCLTDGWQPIFVGLVADGFLDDLETSLKITDIQRDQAFFGEVIKDIWAAEIERQTAAEECIGEFFRPVVRGVVILDGEVIAKGIERFDFGLDEAMAVPEYLEFGDFIFQAAGEFVTQRMQCVALLFGGTDSGEV